MKIGMIQLPVSSDIEQNIQYVRHYSKKCIEMGADVLVLPEMWNTPYVNQAIKKSTLAFDRCKEILRQLSKEYSCLIIGGTLAHEIDKKVYNECLIFDQGSFLTSYQKTHLFELHTNHIDYQEKDVFHAGNRLQTFETRWGKCGILICYDIRFPEVARILTMRGAKLLFCPAAFNRSVTQKHWTPLFQVRAMENQVFMIGVNPAQYRYETFESYGHSVITDPFGQIVYQMNESEPFAVIEIDLNEIDKVRNKMPFWKIRRTDLYTLKEEHINETNSNSSSGCIQDRTCPRS